MKKIIFLTQNMFLKSKVVLIILNGLFKGFN